MHQYPSSSSSLFISSLFISSLFVSSLFVSSYSSFFNLVLYLLASSTSMEKIRNKFDKIK